MLFWGDAMERQYELVIPANDNSGNPIKAGVLADAVDRVTDHFGGSTTFTRTVGCFLSDVTNQVECDENIIVQAVHSGSDVTAQDLAADQAFMVVLAKDVGVQLGQESIFEQQELDTKTRFVPGDRRNVAYPDALANEKRLDRSTLLRNVLRR